MSADCFVEFKECHVSNELIDYFSAVGGAGTADDSDDGESRAQYVSANCVVFTHYRGDAASEVDEHFQRALAHDKLKGWQNTLFRYDLDRGTLYSQT